MLAQIVPNSLRNLKPYNDPSLSLSPKHPMHPSSSYPVCCTLAKSPLRTDWGIIGTVRTATAGPCCPSTTSSPSSTSPITGSAGVPPPDPLVPLCLGQEQGEQDPDWSHICQTSSGQLGHTSQQQSSPCVSCRSTAAPSQVSRELTSGGKQPGNSNCWQNLYRVNK